MKVTYLYDIPGWALHHVGISLQSHFNSDGHQFVMVAAADYHSRPFRTDVLFLSYSGLVRRQFDYSTYADELICTIHDPLEISHFTDRFDWPRQPFRPLQLDRFARVSVISDEMFQAVKRHYEHPALYLTPTFPHDVHELRAIAATRHRGERVRFFSATNARRRHPPTVYFDRVRHLPDYLLDHRQRPSLRQLQGLLIRTNRKNIDQLERIREALQGDTRAEVLFLHSRRAPLPRAEYLTALAHSDVYVCTSFMEGGPLPVMEAVLAGLAVISTPVGQVANWVESGLNGFVSTRGEEMIDAARRYLDDPLLLREHQSNSVAISAARHLLFERWRRFVLGAAA